VREELDVCFCMDMRLDGSMGVVWSRP
jgi:hypothetical protein